MNAYNTIQVPSEGIYTEKGSKFIGYAFPVNSQDHFRDILQEVKEQHPSARHHCYAYRLVIPQEYARQNDDGEPSGTAGRPIMSQIESFGIYQAGIIVTRYFGGVLLGTGGLVQAYKAAARLALEQAIIVEKEIVTEQHFLLPYEKMPAIMAFIKKYKLAYRLTEGYPEFSISVSIPAKLEATAAEELAKFQS